MFSLLWTILEAIAGAAFTFLLGMIAAALVGVGGGLGLLLGLADDVIVWFFSSELSYLEIFALQVAIDEAEKIVHETIVYADEDDASRQARHAALVRWHGNKVYLFGDVHLEDALLLWFSGRELASSGLVASVFQVTGEAAVIL